MVGLGNPGDRYAGTRHNVGFDVVESLALRASGGAPPRIDRLDCRALTGRIQVGGLRLLLARPQTFMNESGASVKGLVVKYRIPAEKVMLVLDETALPVGRIRLRPFGSSGGHNGLQSVLDALGTSEVARLRLGVRGDNFQPGEDQADYVLSRFSRAERPLIDSAISRACDALEVWAAEGIDEAMNRFNRPPEESPAA